MRVIIVLCIVLLGMTLVLMGMELCSRYSNCKKDEEELLITTFEVGYLQGQVSVLESKSKREMDSIHRIDSTVFMRRIEKAIK